MDHEFYFDLHVHDEFDEFEEVVEHAAEEVAAYLAWLEVHAFLEGL